MQRLLIISGLALLAIGLLWPWLARVPWGRLPGDIAIERDDFRLYVPIATSLLVSAVVSALLALWWWWRK